MESGIETAIAVFHSAMKREWYVEEYANQYVSSSQDSQQKSTFEYEFYTSNEFICIQCIRITRECW